MIDIPQGIPSQIIDLAEKNVEQARGAFLGFIGAAQKATAAAETLPSSAKDAMAKAMSFAENNVNAAFDLAQKLVRAKDVRSPWRFGSQGDDENQLQRAIAAHGHVLVSAKIIRDIARR
jgi:hypothetical protein